MRQPNENVIKLLSSEFTLKKKMGQKVGVKGTDLEEVICLIQLITGNTGHKSCQIKPSRDEAGELFYSLILNQHIKAIMMPPQ